MEYYLVSTRREANQCLKKKKKEPMIDQEGLHASLDGESISLNTVIFRIMGSLKIVITLKEISISSKFLFID